MDTSYIVSGIARLAELRQELKGLEIETASKKKEAEEQIWVLKEAIRNIYGAAIDKVASAITDDLANYTGMVCFYLAKDGARVLSEEPRCIQPRWNDWFTDILEKIANLTTVFSVALIGETGELSWNLLLKTGTKYDSAKGQAILAYIRTKISELEKRGGIKIDLTQVV